MLGKSHNNMALQYMPGVSSLFRKRQWSTIFAESEGNYFFQSCVSRNQTETFMKSTVNNKGPSIFGIISASETYRLHSMLHLHQRARGQSSCPRLEIPCIKG